MASAVLHLDTRGTQIGVAIGNELRQQLERFGSGAQHGTYQVMPRLWIGQDLANKQALVNLEAVLIRLHPIALGDEVALGRQNVRPARRCLPKKRVNADRSRAFARKLAVHRHSMAAEKSPRGVGCQMNDRLGRCFLHLRALRAQRQSRQQRAAAADRSTQVGGSKRCDTPVADDQKRFSLGARQRGSEHRGMLFAGNREHRTPLQRDKSVGRRASCGNEMLSQSWLRLSTSRADLMMSVAQGNPEVTVRGRHDRF